VITNPDDPLSESPTLLCFDLSESLQLFSVAAYLLSQSIQYLKDVGELLGIVI
jgi:hypothetical protein